MTSKTVLQQFRFRVYQSVTLNAIRHVNQLATRFVFLLETFDVQNIQLSDIPSLKLWSKKHISLTKSSNEAIKKLYHQAFHIVILKSNMYSNYQTTVGFGKWPIIVAQFCFPWLLSGIHYISAWYLALFHKFIYLIQLGETHNLQDSE